MRRGRLYLACAVVCWLRCGACASAAAPTLTYLFPAGVKRDKTVEVIASGKLERWPVRGWADHPGLSVVALKEKGRLSIAATAGVTPGVHYLRVYDEQGASNLRPFFVGTLPEVAEREPNDDPRKPQAIAGSAVINGRLEKQGDVDGYAIKLQNGETLVASLTANQVLASPCDAVLQVLSPDGLVLAENNDCHGLDPQLAFTAPRDGTYVVRTFGFPAVPNSGIRFSGAETFIYRLTLTTGAFVDYAFPVAVHGGALSVEAIGWNIPTGATTLTVARGAATELLTLTHPLWANTTTVRHELYPVVVEREPNGRAQPQSVSLPCTISGRIDPADDRDVYQFSAKKGQNLAFQVEARIFGSQLTPVLVIADAAGKPLVQPSESTSGRRRRSDPNAARTNGPADLEVPFTAPADGTYRLELRDQYDSGSRSHVYGLRAFAAQPDFDLKLDTDRLMLTPGKPLAVNVAVNRLEGFAGEVELRVVGLPEGVTAPPVRVAGSGKAAKVMLNASNGASAGSIQISGQSAALIRTATAPVAELNMTTSQIWLTVAPTPAKPQAAK